MQPQKIGLGALIAIEIGGFPLVRHRKVQIAVAVHIGRGDTPAHLRITQSHFNSKIVIAAIGSADKERSVLMTAQVVAGSKPVPASGVAKEIIVAQRDFMQFRPAVDRAFHKACGLNDFEDTIIVEVSHSGIPRPSTPRQAQWFTSIYIRRDPLFHQIRLSSTEKEEMA